MVNPVAESPDLRFFTSPEIAELLKLNPRVVNRKLQAGELAGYKLGKDRLVSESQLLAYLERRSNPRRENSPESKAVQAFSDVCTSRRELIIKKLMVRKSGNYQVVGWNRG